LTTSRQTRIIGQKRSDIAEETIYRGIIKVIAIGPNITRLISISITRIYLPSLPRNLKFVILRENKGILLTISNDNIIVKRIRRKGELVNELKRADCEKCPAITIEITAMAFAGIGNPLNDVACVESRLNIARRIAPKTGIIAGIIINKATSNPGEFKSTGPLVDNDLLRSWYIINAGATPKLTTSARLSSSLPIEECALSKRAENPSRKSKIIAASINQDAVSK
jgi:hypothetical protein